MATPLADLDELILKCRNQSAKDHIREAVACYKAGAFRSAIIATWIAVSFDIIQKLKELSLTEDAEAKRQLESFEKATKGADFAILLKFEREILDVCKDKLELISNIEHTDLVRLRDDRNRCAHLSTTVEGEVYHPTAEQVRTHIRSAIEHLLQHPPAQGTKALNLLLSKIKSQYFPTDLEKAHTSLMKSPLYNARESLVRNLIKILLKEILRDQKTQEEQYKIILILKVTEKIHREIYNLTLKESLSEIINSTTPENLPIVIFIICELDSAWSNLDQGIQHKAELYVENLPTEYFDDLSTIINNQNLKKPAEKRIKNSKLAELLRSKMDPPIQLTDKVIQMYSESNSYDRANRLSGLVVKHSQNYTKNQIKTIRELCTSHSEISGSFNVSQVLSSLDSAEKNRESNP